MKGESAGSYPLDNSAIIHLAARQKNYTNGFRIVVTMRETVCMETLQKAVNRITLRFPTVIAGIRRDFFQYHVVPNKVPPRVRKEQECLAPMTEKEIENCAFRVLCSENRIVTEIFHSLTDGYGGMVVTNTLVAEYLKLKHSVPVPVTEMTPDVDCNAKKEELADDYFTYAGKKAKAPKHRKVYQLPGKPKSCYQVQADTKVYRADAILNAAHHYGVTATTLLTAVMIASVMEMQNRYQTEERRKKAVQVMVPVNLRKLFSSRTLRNFSLYALCCMEPQDENRSFEELLGSIGNQLTEQATKEYMEAAMAMNTRAERFPLYRAVPLSLKCMILRLAHRTFGECNSCISISNLGIISLPETMEIFIESIDFMLTPRIRSPYNCGIVSYHGKISINFSRLCGNPELEEVFFSKLDTICENNIDNK